MDHNVNFFGAQYVGFGAQYVGFGAQYVG